MIPGEPLIGPPAYRLPGVRHSTSIRFVVERMILVMAAAGAAAWMALWLWSPPEPECIDLSNYAYPRLDYQGWTDAWVLDGHIVGYSTAEDAECVRPA